MLARHTWRKGIHACGHHIADTIQDGRQLVWQAHLDICTACLEIETWQHEQQQTDEAALKKGQFVPRTARMWRAVKQGGDDG